MVLGVCTVKLLCGFRRGLPNDQWIPSSTKLREYPDIAQVLAEARDPVTGCASFLEKEERM